MVENLAVQKAGMMAAWTGEWRVEPMAETKALSMVDKMVLMMAASWAHQKAGSLV